MFVLKLAYFTAVFNASRYPKTLLVVSLKHGLGLYTSLLRKYSKLGSYISPFSEF